MKSIKFAKTGFLPMKMVVYIALTLIIGFLISAMLFVGFRRITGGVT